MSSFKDNDIKEFFAHIKRIADESERRFDDANSNVCKLMINKIKSSIGAVTLLKSFNLNQDLDLVGITQSMVTDILSNLSVLLTHWDSKLSIKVKECNEPDFARYKLGLQQQSRRGRPSYELDIDQVICLKELRFTWKTISSIIGVHRTTLWRKLKQQHPHVLESVYSTISDDELDAIIKEIKKNHPLAGERMLIGFIRARSLTIQRERVRNSIHRVDPINTAIRWIRKNPRWQYSVPGPNSLWHNDGLHKVIHWKIVVHACIDGYSRLITYLQCSANNLGATVLSAFIEAEKKFGLPARIRGDHGVENYQLATYMREKQGYHHAYIQGPSVHNQRIERLHYDTTHCVLSHYIDLFLFMEENDILDRNNDIDILCLHKVFLPRIQSSLLEFQEAWNQHPVSTEGNRSPYQIWTQGMMNKNFEDQRGVQSYLNSQILTDIDPDQFGVDIDLNGSMRIGENDNNVEIEEVTIGRGNNEIEELFQAFDTLADDENYGINHFLYLKNNVKNLLNIV